MKIDWKDKKKKVAMENLRSKWWRNLGEFMMLVEDKYPELNKIASVGCLNF